MAMRKRDGSSVSSESKRDETEDETTEKLLGRGQTQGEGSVMMKASPSENSIEVGKKDDDLTLNDLIPAVLVSTFVSIGSYYSCDSIDMAEDIIIATLRTFIQLSLLAAFLSPMFRYVDNKSKENPSATTATSIRKNGSVKERIKAVLSNNSAPILVLAYLTCFMLPLAAYEASSRTKLTLRPPNTSFPLVFSIVITSLFTAVVLMGYVAIFLIVRPTPRYSPRHLIPLCGMLFNNCLSSISLALDILFTEFQSKQRDTMELMIIFGADTWTATRPSFRTVLASALKPQINSMNVIGLVAIPGMMTGQVLGGASPVRAARYQIVIMCLILGAGFLAVGMTTELVIWNVFTERGILRDGWIVDNNSLRISQLFSSSSLRIPVMENNLLERSEAKGDVVNSAIKVELRTKNQPTTQQTTEGFPLLNAYLHGEYANGKMIMTAKFKIPTNQDIIIITGPSGIGKSTLLKAIAELSSGFEPSPESSVETIARISLFGRDRSTFHPFEWRQRVMYLPQSSSSNLQGTPESFLHFVASSIAGNRPTKEYLEQLVSETSSYLLAWNVPQPNSLLTSTWSKLSGGESQRVTLAIALAARPQVLLLDEPTSALDESVKLKVEETLKMAAKNGCAIVMVTHDDDQAMRMGTKWLQFEFV